jgi:hypothetical protein
MSPVDPSACPAPRSLREQIESEIAGAEADGKRYVHVNALRTAIAEASLPGDAAQDARPSLFGRGCCCNVHGEDGKRVCPVHAQDAPPAPQGWQPIATAPKDGTRVLLWGPAWVTPRCGQFFGPDWRLLYERPFTGQPTVWQPLPAPPVSEDTP